MCFIHKFYDNVVIPCGCSLSFITLMPKAECPMMVKDFCPTSLIGVQYKIIANVLVNRLSRVLWILL